MKIKKELLRVFEENCYCEKCNCIMTRNSGIMNGRKKVYTCPKCGDHFSTTEEYPRIVYEKVAIAPIKK